MAGLKAVLTMPFAALLAARGTLFHWLAVFLALGISIWFALPFEPGAMFYTVAAFGLCLCGLAYWRGPDAMQPLAAAGMALLAGGASIGNSGAFGGRPDARFSLLRRGAGPGDRD